MAETSATAATQGGMTDHIHVTGVFPDEDACARGVIELREAGFAKLAVFSPFASEKISEALHHARSPVRRWVLLGGLAGCTTGFALTIGLSSEYPHVTAGMPIVSIPPFVIIAFELTILFGALSGLFGFIVHGGFPQLESAPGYDIRFSNDCFGVVISCPVADYSRAAAAIRSAGALEVSDAPG